MSSLTAKDIKRPVLIVSPIPSHPQNQGNSGRIFRIGRLFQSIGHPVHFIYLGLEGLTPDQAAAHSSCWERFYFIKPNGPAPAPSLGDHYHVDDWFDERVTELVATLCCQWDYAVCLSHYVWCSKHLEILPDSVYKVIDTHDVFGDRHLVAKEAGLEPVWFYTSKALEKMALERADLIIAIQDVEEIYFRELIEGTDVTTIGFALPNEPSLSRVRKSDEPIYIGYMGSGNPFNVLSIERFATAVKARQAELSNYEFHLAGTICENFSDSGKVFKIWGRVDSVEPFYAEMDLLINPMVGGTGLKIKSLEALSFGKPLLATCDAMIGVVAADNPAVYTSPEEIVEDLVSGDYRVFEPEVNKAYAQGVVDNFIRYFGDR